MKILKRYRGREIFSVLPSYVKTIYFVQVLTNRRIQKSNLTEGLEHSHASKFLGSTLNQNFFKESQGVRGPSS